ncbi:MAG: hypothetical protein EU541_06335 [Promethearchaeota archaeon]|nr:MAG: hypothetical protein EU541_06335 [Candidatus Lokiarchaeota archaeon]
MNTKRIALNQYLTLKLENEKIMLYVKGRKFKQLKNLKSLISFKEISPSKKKETLTEKDLKSAEKRFSMNINKYKRWIKEDYNPTLLKGFTGFIILEKLYEIGDPTAKKVFTKEICSAFKTNDSPIINDLKRGGYLNYLNQDQLKELLIDKYNIKKKELDLSGFGLNEIPQFVFELKDIKILNLESNFLENLSGAIEELNNLQILNLNYNNLKTLPESIGNLNSLEQLLLLNNKLEMLPETISNLESLKILDMGPNPHPRIYGTNRLNKIPKSIGNLTSIISLDFEDNELDFLPDSIGKLKSLKELLLGGNNLKSLPESILHLNSDLLLSLWGNPCLENSDPITKRVLNHFEGIIL